MFDSPAVLERQDVWCPTTGLGTWTMLQDGQVMLTGNSTFATYAGRFRPVGPFLYGVSVNPLANSYAGGNYAVHRYGSLAAVDPRVRHAGYDDGGWLPPGLSLAYNGTGQPERVLSPVSSSGTATTIERVDIDYRRLGVEVARAMTGVRVQMDGRTVGAIQGRQADLLARGG